jgi:uncharacterized membrane protein YjjB (DUF3815 family)
MDFEAGTSEPLRLDQIDALYRLIDDIRHGLVDTEPARTRLDDLLASRPRFGGVISVLASGILTVGLGLMLNPTANALPAFLSIGFLVGALRWWADRERMLSLVLPVTTAAVVTAIVFKWVAPALHTPPLEIVIPTLVTFLPGAALTMATVELSTGDILAGFRTAGARPRTPAGPGLRHCHGSRDRRLSDAVRRHDLGPGRVGALGWCAGLRCRPVHRLVRAAEDPRMAVAGPLRGLRRAGVLRAGPGHPGSLLPRRRDRPPGLLRDPEPP